MKGNVIRELWTFKIFVLSTLEIESINRSINFVCSCVVPAADNDWRHSAFTFLHTFPPVSVRVSVVGKVDVRVPASPVDVRMFPNDWEQKYATADDRGYSLFAWTGVSDKGRIEALFCLASVTSYNNSLQVTTPYKSYFALQYIKRQTSVAVRLQVKVCGLCW